MSINLSGSRGGVHKSCGSLLHTTTTRQRLEINGPSFLQKRPDEEDLARRARSVRQQQVV
jgi:hypothetical protein